MNPTPDMTFSRRIGNTNFRVRVYCDPDSNATFEERLLNVIRHDAEQLENPPNESHTIRSPAGVQERSA